MKKFRKVLALALVASMTMTSVAFADEVTTNVEFSDQGGVENDNSVLPTFAHCVLPTMNDGTYNFIVDVDGLLKEYDSVNYDNSTVYFNALKTAAKLEFIGTDTSKFGLATLEKVVDTGCVELAKMFEDTNADGVVDEVAEFTAKFYVWAPNGTAGAGAYKEITKDNYATYVDVTSTTGTITVTPKTHNVGTADTVFDGNIYKEVYTALADMTKAATYVTYENDAISAVDGLYYTADNTATPAPTYTKLVVADADTGETVANTVIKYVEEVRTNTKTSDLAKIVNKAYNPVAVKVAVEVKNVSDDYMTFATAESAFGATPDKAELYIAITDNAGTPNTKAVDATKKTAEMYYVIGGIDADTLNQYQLKTPTVDTTGSHTYVNYEAASTTPSSASFAITGAANANDKDVWADYVAALEDSESGVVRPEINVVFSFENVEEVATTVDATTTYAYVGDVATYTVNGGTASGAQGVAVAVDNEVAATLSYTSGTPAEGVVLTFDPGTETVTLSSDYLTVNGKVISGWKSYSTRVTYSDNAVTITSAVFSDSTVAAVTTDNTYTFVLKDSAGNEYSVTKVFE